MHILPITTISLEEGEEPIDLQQPPGDIVALSFADSDLGALAAAHDRLEGAPSLRLASMRRLRHPLSIDLYIQRTVIRARFVLVRCLGGVDYWRYGLESLSAACHAHGVALAVLSGDDSPDSRLPAFATVSAQTCDQLEAYFRAGGVENMERLIARISSMIGETRFSIEPPKSLPRGFAWDGGRACEPEAALASLSGDRPLVHLLAYRSGLLAGDGAAVEALADALRVRRFDVLILGVSSLKDFEAAEVVRRSIRARRPSVIVAVMAFSARQDAGFALDEADCPIIQATPVGATREAWNASPRGLSSVDIVMQAALPEFDGRIAGGPISFKSEGAPDPRRVFARRSQEPWAEGITHVADLAAAWTRLARKPRSQRRLALIMSDYPARGGRAGFAVGLDTPASACVVLDILVQAGYSAARDFAAEDLMATLTLGSPIFTVPLSAYCAWFDALPVSARAALVERWGPPHEDPQVRDGAFRFRAIRAGGVLIALQPDRARDSNRKNAYHDPNLVPTHAFLAFYFAIREVEKVDALVHLGTHGTTEWLPGKALALSPACWPRIMTGALPVIYPFIVDDPGEAAPAKRRIGAITIGHLTPTVCEAGLHGEAAALRELVEEYSAARTLHPARAELVARQILDRADACGLAAACGADAATGIDEALSVLDAHLCDLAETCVRDGLHIFARAAQGFEACSTGERDGLLAALDGRFVAPGPAGSPSRGQTDVLPTGRNLFTLDPRSIPTRAATELGWRAAAEVVRRHLQEDGDWPRRIVMDLWASPTLRTGGEDIAHALALMGARPTWDPTSTRVTGFEIVPQPALDRPRADVTLRVSGAFRDTFPEKIALLDQAARAVAALDEEDAWNELAAARRRGEAPARVFGSAPGLYGAGVSSRALDGEWSDPRDLGETYLVSVSHAYCAASEGREDRSFSQRVAQAQAFIHVSDVAERDVMDGDAVADSMGGFAAAARSLGAAPALYSVDVSRAAPKARLLREDIDRIVRAKLTSPRWLDTQLRHGWRGGAEIAQGVDALFAFAATTCDVPEGVFDLVHAALFGDELMRTRLEAANAPAAEAIRARLADAARRGLWRTRLNSVGALPEDEAPH